MAGFTPGTALAPRIASAAVASFLSCKTAVIFTRFIMNNPIITPTEADTILENSGTHRNIGDLIVKSLETATLAGNIVSEDAHYAVRHINNAYTFAVFDGHGGRACVDAVAPRIFDYISVALMPQEIISQMPTELVKMGNLYHNLLHITENYTPESENYFTTHLKEFVDVLKSDYRPFSISQRLTEAIVRLDKDLGRQACDSYASNSNLKHVLVNAAFSGTVGTVAHIDRNKIHVANFGDCRAILGSFNSASNSWVPIRLSSDHVFQNLDEITRIYAEHPSRESNTLFSDGRLLGRLIPLRALGDFQYKWQKPLLSRLCHANDIPPNYDSPPYLTSTPEVLVHTIQPDEKFLILLSDGVSESISSTEIVGIVGKHFHHKRNSDCFLSVHSNLAELQQNLKEYLTTIQEMPRDRNGATSLLRYAIAGPYDTWHYDRLVKTLSLPPESRRSYRDDMSIMIIYFE